MIIGVTGGIGSGKTTIINILKSSFGAEILIADNIGKSLMKPGNSCYDKIIEIFGNDILIDVPNDIMFGASKKDIAPSIDRKKLSEIVFNDPKKLKTLESVIHPAVKNEILISVADIYRKTPEKLIVIEAALLIEAGYKEICDDLWVVTADKNVRIERLMLSRKYSLDKCESIMNAQLSEEEYVANADFVIDNSGNIENTAEQIRKRLTEIGQIKK